MKLNFLNRCIGIQNGGDKHLFSDDNPETTLKGLGFKNKQKAIDSIILIEKTFSDMRDKQRIHGCSPKKLRPRYYLDTKEAVEKFYLQQKMYRVLGLLNRAKMISYRYPKEDILEAIEVLQKWMDEYREIIKKYIGIHYIKCE